MNENSLVIESSYTKNMKTFSLFILFGIVLGLLTREATAISETKCNQKRDDAVEELVKEQSIIDEFLTDQMNTFKKEAEELEKGMADSDNLFNELDELRAYIDTILAVIKTLEEENDEANKALEEIKTLEKDNSEIKVAIKALEEENKNASVELLNLKSKNEKALNELMANNEKMLENEKSKALKDLEEEKDKLKTEFANLIKEKEDEIKIKDDLAEERLNKISRNTENLRAENNALKTQLSDCRRG